MNIKELPTPDYSFSPVLLDMAVPGCPLPRLRKVDNYNQPGVYAWTNADTGEVLYIGKALRMRNRLQQHWYADTDIVEIMLDAGIVPCVHVWLCPGDKRAGLERAMIDKAQPPLNKRRD